MSSLPYTYRNTYERYVNLLGTVGLDFFEESRGCFVKRNIKLLIFNILFLPFAAIQFGLMLKINAENFLEGALVIPIVVMFALDIIKMAIGVAKRSDIKYIFDEIGKLWPREDDVDKNIILTIWLRRIGLLLNSFFIFAVSNLAMFETYPFLRTCYNLYVGNDDYILPFQLCGLWEVKSTVVYILTYILEIVGTTPCQLFLYLPFDLLIVTLTSNVSILLRLLQADLQNAVRLHRERPNTYYVNDHESYERIKEIVFRHQRILRIADKLSEVFGLVILVHVSLSAVVICFFGFLTVVYGGLIETISNFLTALNLILIVFLIALGGQLLCDTSSNISDAAYNSLWYEGDLKLRKLMLFIITRSQNPCYLSALGFSNMTLRSFSKIMSTAWTYLSLLIQVYEGN
ncbi:odorant receptor 85c-like [Bombyx mandarina]|uniref:Odorant receptor n=1 Tax=Bombyx mandarina TaxID=7092 RepID=A0A6J2KA32_BOMMA|nr:odorant receptor 85c-like [Bombyx mandarina]